MTAQPIKPPAAVRDAAAIEARHAERMRSVPQATVKGNRDSGKEAGKPGLAGAGKRTV
jgi:hypothetical protein